MTHTTSRDSQINLWDEPHHDSGACFVSNPRPALGETVEVRVFVPGPGQVNNVVVRQIVDGEICITEMTPTPDEYGTWWVGDIVAHNLVNRYRFCLIGDRGGEQAYRWLTAAGLYDHDISDSTDFVLSTHQGAPEWVEQAVVYQIFPDRYARSGRDHELPDWAVPTSWDTPPRFNSTAHQYYGGDLWGVIDKLDHIIELGANTIYLTPVFPAGSVHRYDASSFDRVDPLLGGDEALVALTRAAHERGLRVILDLTTNHTGMTHEWFTRARLDPESPERSFYYFKEYPDEWVGWLNIPSLPKVNHTNAGLRERLYEADDSVAAHWLAEPYLIDGWRIDVANMTGRHGGSDVAHQVAASIRQTMARVSDRTGRQTWLVAEHGHDASRDLMGGGWHGTMNYQGFTRPLWAWLSDPDNDIDWLGLPMKVPHLSGGQIMSSLRDYNAEIPWPGVVGSQIQLDSHDTPRFRSVVGSDEKLLVGLAALMTLPGVPTIFAGDEFAHTGTNGESSRTTIDWDALEQSRPATLETFRQWTRLRRSEIGLQSGGIRWLSAQPDALVFLRTHPQGDLLVVLARAAHDELRIPANALRSGGIDLLLGTGLVRLSSANGQIIISATGPGAAVARVV